MSGAVLWTEVDCFVIRLLTWRPKKTVLLFSHIHMYMSTFVLSGLSIRAITGYNPGWFIPIVSIHFFFSLVMIGRWFIAPS